MIMMKNYRETDPEFAERVEHFAFDEVVNEPGQQLEPVTRHMAILATLLGCQGKEEFAEELPRALDAGLTPVMVKEVVYQACAYLGIGRVRPFVDAANELRAARGVELPLEPQATTTLETRCAAGNQTMFLILHRTGSDGNVGKHIRKQTITATQSDSTKSITYITMAITGTALKKPTGSVKKLLKKYKQGLGNLNSFRFRCRDLN